ncbi:hypothetical protein [Methylovulum psychrotolerans]|uniref:Uncharacterized protein n=1 Tax=Methylovulum psychrotolerans TaxID=1704499 RepID=A0A2S5CL47_9GAMM|nr:hypothetical protein [Methylovulum psychrotolerans]POZ51545.1 hypothetical protein AADEFJLK_02411 [Methylovulum psychrotolerans]
MAAGQGALKKIEGGVNDVYVRADRYAKISPGQVQELLTKYQNVYAERKSVGLEGPEHAGYSSVGLIKFQYEGEPVEIYGSVIHQAFAYLKPISPIEKWLCYPKKNPMHTLCPIEG